MAGPGGFEPPHDRIKTCCLTAWRRPNILLNTSMPNHPWCRVPVQASLLTRSAGKRQITGLFFFRFALTAWRRPNILFTFAFALLRTDAMAMYSSLWRQRLPSVLVMPAAPAWPVPGFRNRQKHRHRFRSFEPGRIALV